MAKISISQASNTFKVSRPTIYKKIKKGELSCSLDEEGKRIIDVSELVRVFGEPPVESVKGNTVNDSRHLQSLTLPIDSNLQAENAALQSEVRLLREQIAMLQSDKEDYRKRLDRQFEECQRVQLLLTDERSKKGVFRGIFRQRKTP